MARDTRSYEVQLIDAVRSVNRALGGSTASTSSAIYKSDFDQFQVQLVDAIKGVARTLSGSGLSFGTGVGEGRGGMSQVYIGTTKGQEQASPQALTGITTIDASGLATIRGGISLGGTYSGADSKVVWDSDAGAWHFIGNLYADGWVSAGGVGTGGGGITSLSALTDVYGSGGDVLHADGTPADAGDSLVYSSTLSKWVAAPVSGGGGGGDSLIHDTTDGGSTTAGTWKATCSDVSSLTDGLTIRYKVTVAGASTTKLNLNGLGAKTVYRYGSTKVTTHYAVGSYLLLYYSSTLNSGSWLVYSDYDGNTNTYQRLYPSSDNTEYAVTSRYNTTTGSSYYNEYGRYTMGVTLNPGLNQITADRFKVAGGSSTQFLRGDGSCTSLSASDMPSLYVLGTSVTATAAPGTMLGVTAISTGLSSTGEELSLIKWEQSVNAWHFLGNVYADGWVSAGGVGSSGSGGSSTLRGLDDVNIVGTPSNGQVLVYRSGFWVNETFQPGSDVSWTGSGTGWTKLKVGNDERTLLTDQALEGYVTIATPQEISGAKTFTSGIVTIKTTGVPTLLLNKSNNNYQWLISNDSGSLSFIRRNASQSTDTETIFLSSSALNPGGTNTGGVSDITCGRQNYRWGKVWSADADLSGTLRVGNAMLVYDSTAKALRVYGTDGGDGIGFYCDSWVAAGGVGQGQGSAIFLSDLEDVEDGNPANGDLLVYNSTAREWKYTRQSAIVPTLSVNTTGDGNAITGVNYYNGTFNFNKGTTFVVPQDLIDYLPRTGGTIAGNLAVTGTTILSGNVSQASSNPAWTITSGGDAYFNAIYVDDIYAKSTGGVVWINNSVELDGNLSVSSASYIKVGNSYLVYDGDAKALKVYGTDGGTPVGFYCTAWISAGGVGASGVGGGSLESLGDVNISSPHESGDLLRYDGTEWVNVPQSEIVPTITRTITGNGNAITDVSITGTAFTFTKGATFLTTETDPVFSASPAAGITDNDISKWDIVKTAQSANKVFAGPSSGNSATPSFRALVAADIPSIPKSKISDFPSTWSWSAIDNTPTDLAGYGIADAKIENGVITLGGSTITPITALTEGAGITISDTATGTRRIGISAAYQDDIASGASAYDFLHTARKKNYVLAGPTTGNNQVPTFRLLVAADIPDLKSTYLSLTQGGTIQADVNIDQASLYGYDADGNPSWSIGENGDASFSTLDVGGTPVVTSVSLAGGTQSGTMKLTVNGTTTDNIAVTNVVTTDTTQSISGLKKFRENVQMVDKHIAFYDSAGTTKYASLQAGGTYFQINIGSGKYFLYPNYGFFFNGGGVPVGRSDHRWSNVYSVSGDFSGAVTLSGTTDATRRIYFGSSSHYIELKDLGNGDYAFHFSDGIYSDSWVSAGGIQQNT